MKQPEKSEIKLALLGHPVAQSLSPLIHETWLGQYGFAGKYDVFDVAPDALSQTAGRLAEEGYRGFNMTIPHKTAIMKLCAQVDETARRTGAVNTVAIREGGALSGMNTDSYGFCENMREQAPGFDFGKGPALVLGAGGAARAIVHGLLNLGAREIKIANRTRGKVEEIAATFPVKVADWDRREDAARDCAILVNATSLGMRGQGALDFDPAVLPPAALVCDIVYKPLQTKLLQEAAACGHKTVTGLGMLLHQARPAFKAWCGVMPEITPALRAELEKRASS